MREAAATINAHQPRPTGTAQLSDVSCASRRGRGQRLPSPHKPSASACLPSSPTAGCVGFRQGIDRRSSMMPAEMSCSSSCVITHLPVYSTCPEMFAPTQDVDLPALRPILPATDEDQRDTESAAGFGAFTTSSATVVSGML